jgi:uncharacterized protein (TIGR03435 family)
MNVYRKSLVANAGIILAVASSFSQAQDVPRFDVATLKVSPPPKGDSFAINLGDFRNGRLTMTNVTLNDAIKFAYELPSDDLLVGPDWNSSVRFDLVALAPAATSPDQLHSMVRALVAERLHLVVRREQRVVSYLALVVGKNGARMPSAKVDAPPNGPQVRGRIAHNQMTMALLALLLSRFERQTIVDLTGLSGSFEVKLEWAPDALLARDDPPSDRPSLFTAVQNQLGLRLESRRGPLAVLIVEQATKVPEEN